MPSPATKRDATRIKELAQKILSAAITINGPQLTNEAEGYLKQIIQIATDIDARSGRRDDSSYTREGKKPPRRPRKRSTK